MSSAAPSVMMLTSDDPVLVEASFENLLGELRTRHDGAIELSLSELSEVDLSQYLLRAAQVSMFGSPLVVVLRVGERMADEDVETVRSAIASKEEENYLIILSSKAQPKALVELVNQHGKVLDSRLSTAGSRSSHLTKEIDRSGLNFTPGAIDALALSMGNDVSMVQAILEVVAASFAPGALIDGDDLEPYLAEEGDIAPWTLTDKVERGDVAASLELVDRMMSRGGKAAPLLTATLAKRMMELASISSISLRGPESINAVLGGRPRPPSVANAMHRLAVSLKLGDYQRIFSWLGETERNLRGGSGLDENIQVEILVARLASLFHSRRRGGR